MRSDHIKNQMRQGIVKKSVQILREQGKTDEEIRSIILSGFHIEEKALNEILNTEEKR